MLGAGCPHGAGSLVRDLGILNSNGTGQDKSGVFSRNTVSKAIESREERGPSGWGTSRKWFMKETAVGKDLERGRNGDGRTRDQEHCAN